MLIAVVCSDSVSRWVLRSHPEAGSKQPEGWDSSYAT